MEKTTVAYGLRFLSAVWRRSLASGCAAYAGSLLADVHGSISAELESRVMARGHVSRHSYKHPLNAPNKVYASLFQSFWIHNSE